MLTDNADGRNTQMAQILGKIIENQRYHAYGRQVCEKRIRPILIGQYLILVISAKSARKRSNKN